MLLVLIVFLIALAFEYINGFHDTANSIATTVSTKVLTPRQAVILAATFNLIGALVGVSVATTIGKGLVDTCFVTIHTIVCALLSAIIWNLLTWWLGLPSSSSHALIGGLCGATLASADGNWSVIKWSVVNANSGKMEGLWHKVVIPMFTSPTLGFFVGFIIMGILLITLKKLTPRLINAIFGKLQLVSASWMGFSHGTNDAQKTMGIIALILFTATKDGTFKYPRLPALPQNTRIQSCYMGQSRVRSYHGVRHSRWRMANHQDPRPQNGTASADSWICSRNHGSNNNTNRQSLGYSPFHNTYYINIHYGCRSSQTFKRS